MITILSGGKPSPAWLKSACQDYEKRLRKPFDIKWEILSEEKLNKRLDSWQFNSQDYVIILDERGENLTSTAISSKLNHELMNNKNIFIIIGGAFGVSESVRQKAHFVWSFSNLVFPHLLMRLLLCEQIYRAQEIIHGGKYHHA